MTVVPGGQVEKLPDPKVGDKRELFFPLGPYAIVVMQVFIGFGREHRPEGWGGWTTTQETDFADLHSLPREVQALLMQASWQ